MIFEYDESESLFNKEKYDISFVEACALWNDADLLEILAKTVKDEGRCLVIGKIEGKHWSAVITYRDDSLRIISVSRSRKMEVVAYES